MTVAYAQFLTDMANECHIALNINNLTVTVVDASQHPNTACGVVLMASPLGVFVRTGSRQANMIAAINPGLVGTGGVVVMPSLGQLNCTNVAVLVHELGHAYGWCTGGFALVGNPGRAQDESYACRKEMEWLATLKNSNTATGTVLTNGLQAFVTGRVQVWRRYQVRVPFIVMMNNCGLQNASTLWPQ